MRIRDYRLVLVAAAALLSGACATSQEWAIWSQHPAHFASIEHIRFSLDNRAGGPAHVTREDVVEARAQHWWGEPVAVRQAQLFDR
jgi:hypothetical protein